MLSIDDHAGFGFEPVGLRSYVQLGTLADAPSKEPSGRDYVLEGPLSQSPGGLPHELPKD